MTRNPPRCLWMGRRYFRKCDRVLSSNTGFAKITGACRQPDYTQGCSGQLFNLKLAGDDRHSPTGLETSEDWAKVYDRDGDSADASLTSAEIAFHSGCRYPFQIHREAQPREDKEYPLLSE